MLESLTRLGVTWQRQDAGDDYLVHGVGGAQPPGFPVKRADLFLGNAGTAFRSLTAATALAGGHYTLHGVPRMHERPIGDLVNALRQLGAQITYLGNEGFPPLAMAPATLAAVSEASVKGNVSSQYLTGLLLSAPLLGRDVHHPGRGRTDFQALCGNHPQSDAAFRRRGGSRWLATLHRAGLGLPQPGRDQVEGDASSASYFLAAGALGHGPVRVEGVGRNSIQGDVRFAEALARMGVEIGFGRDATTSWIESHDTAASCRLWTSIATTSQTRR